MPLRIRQCRNQPPHIFCPGQVSGLAVPALRKNPHDLGEHLDALGSHPADGDGLPRLYPSASGQWNQLISPSVRNYDVQDVGY